MNHTTVLQFLEKELKVVLEKIGGTSASIQFEHPKDETHGDYSTNVAFQLSKELKKAPLQIAQDIVDAFPEVEGIAKAKVAAPGFVNFWFTPEVLLQELTTISQRQDRYGANDWGKGKKWSIEHTSPNPNKAMHLGHLRNTVTAMAISNLWEYCGMEVVRDMIDNNRGIAIAKLMWGFLKFAHKEDKQITDIDYWYEHQDEWQTPEDVSMRPDRFVDDLYVTGEADFSSNAEVEQKVRQIVVDWEAHNEKIWALWEHVLGYSYQGQKLTMERLNSRFDKTWHEHELYKFGKDLVEQGLKKGIFRKLEGGAILTDLEEHYGLQDTIVIKKDGTSLYITQDLALTKLRHELFQADKMFWVVGSEQELAFKQFFAVCEQLGIGKLENFVHLSYGRMSIKGQGKMSSRLGNVLFIDDLIDLAKEGMLEKMDTTRFSPEEAENVAEKGALSAVKYSILRVGRTMNMAFDMESSISLEGNSGPYLQYAYARARSVLRKAGTADGELGEFPIFNFQSPINQEEMDILRHLYRFEETVIEAAATYSPHLVCTFLFELAKRYNSFYNAHQITNLDDKQREQFRLLLTQSTAQVLKNGLALLNIDVVERM